MKEPNYKFYFRLVFIKLISIVLLCGSAIMGLLFILDSTYPFFKYTSLFSYIVCFIIIILTLIGLFLIVKKFKLKKFQQASKAIKLKYNFAVLLCSLLAISSIEYVLYLTNIDKVTIDKDILEYSIQDALDNINNHIGINEQYESLYDKILQNICDSTSYLCYYENDEYFLVINSDTIEIRLHKKAGMSPPMYIRKQDKEHNFYGVHECGISLKNESYNQSHPASSNLRTEIVSCDSISGKNIKTLIEQKVQYYKNRKDRFYQILEKDRHISFWEALYIILCKCRIRDSEMSLVFSLLLNL